MFVQNHLVKSRPTAHIAGGNRRSGTEVGGGDLVEENAAEIDLKYASAPHINTGS